MVVWKLALATRPTGFSRCVCIIKPDKTFIFRAVKRERIPDAVRPFRRRFPTFDIELHPKTRFMDNVCVAVECQKVFESVIFFPAFSTHSSRLSESDNNPGIIW